MDAVQTSGPGAGRWLPWLGVCCHGPVQGRTGARTGQRSVGAHWAASLRVQYHHNISGHMPMSIHHYKLQNWQPLFFFTIRPQLSLVGLWYFVILITAFLPNPLAPCKFDGDKARRMSACPMSLSLPRVQCCGHRSVGVRTRAPPPQQHHRTTAARQINYPPIQPIRRIFTRTPLIICKHIRQQS